MILPVFEALYCGTLSEFVFCPNNDKWDSTLIQSIRRVKTGPQASVHPTSERWVFLDVVRGIAALAVMLQHSVWHNFEAFAAFSISFWSAGRFGVVAFFLVSGFIVPQSLEKKGDIKEFWIGRFFRLFPLYWACLAIMAMVIAVGFQVTTAINPSNWTHWLINMTMIEGILRQPEAIPVAWTLGLEMVLYGAITLAYRLNFLHKTRLIAGMLLFTATLSSVLVPVLLQIRYPAGAVAVCAAIVGGLVLYRSHSRKISSNEALVWILLCMGSIAVSALFNYQDARDMANQLQPTRLCAIISSISGFLFFLILMNYKTGSFYQSSVGKAFLWLGKISYSLYLLHPLVNDLIVVQDSPVVNVLVQTAASIAVAYLAYTFIEKPGIALGKKFLTKKVAA